MRKGSSKILIRNLRKQAEAKQCDIHIVSSSVLKAIEEMKLGGTQQYALGNDDAVRKVLRLLNDC